MFENPPRSNGTTGLKPVKRAVRSRLAFTLVEVVMALAIISFGLVSMVGLLAVGMNTFRDSIRATTETQIVQRLANQLSLADYSAISSSAVQTSYYNQEGVSTTAGNAIYTATIAAPKTLVVPGGVSASVTNTLTFVIGIRNKTAPQSNHAIPIQIANNGL